MHEYHVSFPTWSTVAAFCPVPLQQLSFENLIERSSAEVHIGRQVGKVYRLVLQSGEGVFAVLAVLLAFATQARRKSNRNGQESYYDRVRRQSSPRSWEVALVPFPGDFAPLPTLQETGAAQEAQWNFPPSLSELTSRAVSFQLLALAEVGSTVTADHLVQMATMPPKHKPTALEIPAHLPIPYQLDCSRAMLQSLHSLFGLIATGDTLTFCPQAAEFSKELCTAARTDNGHIVSLATGWALALRSERSTIAVAGVFGAGKTRSLTFLLPWLAITTNLKIGVAHKENPAGRAITKLLTSFDLQPYHREHFIRPVGREEVEANTAKTEFDLPAAEAASKIPSCRVVITTTGLVWEQKGQSHCTLNAHMEDIDILINEEAQQDMDLKTAFTPAVPRQPFFRAILGDPKQSPGGVADDQKAHRTFGRLACNGSRL